MPIPARKISLLAMVCAVVGFPAIATAQDQPKNYMKGIKIISLHPVSVEKTVGGDGCKIDEENLNTSLQFVANQSTNLKIMTEREYSERTTKRILQVEQATRAGSLSLAERDAARMAAAVYMLMPYFLIHISPLQTQFACAGTISAKLSVYTEKAQTVPTHVPISEPVEVWSVEYGFVGPQQSFSNQAINLAEQMMKRLVNDWATSQ